MPVRRLLACAALVTATIVVLSAAPVLNEPLTGRQVFPTTNWWNLDTSHAPVDPRSAQLIGWISGRTTSNPSAVRRLHPDFGPPPYGFPYVVVGSDQIRVPLTFVDFPREIVHVPREVAEIAFEEIERWDTPDYGGHFPALEVPDVFVDSLVRFSR